VSVEDYWQNHCPRVAHLKVKYMLCVAILSHLRGAVDQLSWMEKILDDIVSVAISQEELVGEVWFVEVEMMFCVCAQPSLQGLDSAHNFYCDGKCSYALRTDFRQISGDTFLFSLFSDSGDVRY